VASGTFWRRAASAALAAATALLAACGGGGDSEVPAAPASAFPPSWTFANTCTPEREKQFVRSFMDETYLWYDEIPAVNAADYASVPAYFNALLVKPKDRFSAVRPSSSASSLPWLAGVLQDGGVPANLLAAPGKSVPITRVVASPSGRRVGYILFNDHNAGAQDELIASFAALRSAGVDDLVLDMRYNTGGFLYVAQAAASMVTGPQSEGRIFEQLRFNARRQVESAAATYLFSSRVQTAEQAFPRGAELPQLKLPRLYVLSSGQTCSASESIVNSLRGIDVEVVLVGGTTCGKPYGFHRQDNCGLSFFAIEFQGYNAKNFGDYGSGFPATCPVEDGLTSALGSTTEPLLSAALHHIDTGSCPAAAATRLLPPSSGRAAAPLATRPPWDGRLLKQ
jgi:hypothetical protein